MSTGIIETIFYTDNKFNVSPHIASYSIALRKVYETQVVKDVAEKTVN